jgi:hypothetical protein
VETVTQPLARLGAALPANAERAPHALGKLMRIEIDKCVPLIQAVRVRN